MRINNTTGFNVFPTLVLMLEKDINAIKLVLQTNDISPKSQYFLDSLLFAKQKILELIPKFNSEQNEGVGTVPSKEQITGKRLKSYILAGDQVKMINGLLSSEQMQRSMVKKAIHTTNLPLELKIKLKRVLRIYEHILDQLIRSQSTQQMGTIVI